MNKLVLGLWNTGDGTFHNKLSSSEAKEIIRVALKSGITSFDTAFSYKEADSYLSSIIKETKTQRETIEITTKVMPVPSLEKKVEISLKRLNTDYVDRLLLHWPSDNNSLFNSLKKLENIKNSNKTKEIGVSNFSKLLLKKVKNDFEITVHQKPYSLLWNENFEFEKKNNIKVMAYAPLAFGNLKSERLKNDKMNSKLFIPPLSLPLWATLKEKLIYLEEKYKTKVEDIAFTFVLKNSPDEIVQGFSSPSQINLIKEIEMEKNDWNDIENLSSLLFISSKTDNIFGHNYLKC